MSLDDDADDDDDDVLVEATSRVGGIEMGGALEAWFSHSSSRIIFTENNIYIIIMLYLVLQQ